MVVDGDGSAEGEVHGDGGEVHGRDTGFPLRKQVYDVEFVDELKVRQGMTVGLFEDVDERFVTVVAAWDDVEQAIFFFRLQNETVVLFEAV